MESEKLPTLFPTELFPVGNNLLKTSFFRPLLKIFTGNNTRATFLKNFLVTTIGSVRLGDALL